MHRSDRPFQDSIPRPFLSEEGVGRKPVIGWREWVSLPDLDLAFVEAKIDTGARSSSLDADVIGEFQRGRERWLRFACFADTDLSQMGKLVEARLIGYRDVRSSSGQVSNRPVVETTLRLGLNNWPVEFTLNRRRTMGFRLLLGRSAIADRFQVDSGHIHLWGRS